MINNQKLAVEVFDSMNTAIEAAKEMFSIIDSKESDFLELSSILLELLGGIQGIADELSKEESKINTPAAIRSCISSLTNIRRTYYNSKMEIAKQKLEFELIPLLLDMRLLYYFWGMCYPDEQRIKQYLEHDRFGLYENPYYEEAEKTGIYKYELSVVILAYNHLDYTKQCVENFLRYMPPNISYELILCNHGSTDGTKEYFESIVPNKQLDISVNGGGMGAVNRIVEGKYMMLISNDVLVTENAIRNMYDCINSDEKIAWVVPSTSNVSNLQSIDLYYTFEEMLQVASQNNSPDIYRREQRTRLCNPIDIKRMKAFESMGLATFFYSNDGYTFPDDKNACFCRRNGYKMMLVKDAYCHHFGSLTINNSEQNDKLQERYLRGMRLFEKTFGINPWGKGFCYSHELFDEIKFSEKKHVNVLGINCGMGSNSLKIKESIKEQAHNEDVWLCNWTWEKCYSEDLKGISDEFKFVSSLDDVKDQIPKFDYIISESENFTEEQFKNYIKLLITYKKKGAKIIIRFRECEKNIIRDVSQTFVCIKDNAFSGYWAIFQE